MGANQPLCPLILSRSRLYFNGFLLFEINFNFKFIFYTVYREFLGTNYCLKNIFTSIYQLITGQILSNFGIFFFTLQEVLVNRNFAKV